MSNTSTKTFPATTSPIATIASPPQKKINYNNYSSNHKKDATSIGRSPKSKKPRRKISTEELDCSLIEDTNSLLALSAATATEYQNINFGVTSPESAPSATASSSSSSASPKQHSPESEQCEFGACDFCRRRHMPCVGRPECSNCKRREQKCIFTPKRKPGPPLGYKRPAKEKKANDSSSVSPECGESSTSSDDFEPEQPKPKQQTVYYHRSTKSQSESPPEVQPAPYKPSAKPPQSNNNSLPVIPTPQHPPQIQHPHNQHNQPRRVPPFATPNTIINGAASVLELNLSGSCHNKVPATILQTYAQLLQSQHKDGLEQSSFHTKTKTTTPTHHHLNINASVPPSPTPPSPYLMLFPSSPSPSVPSPLPGGMELSSLAEFFSPDGSHPSPLLSCEEHPNTIDHTNDHIANNNHIYVNTTTLPQTGGCNSSLVSYTSSASSSASASTIISSNSESIGSALHPYAEYLASFRRRHKDDVMGIFNFIEVPSLEYLLPLAATNIEGRVKQMLLFSLLALGALGKKHKDRAIFFGEEAYRLYCEHAKWKQQEEQRTGMPLLEPLFQGQEEYCRVEELCCTSLITLSTFCYAMGQLERAHKLSFISYQLSLRLLDSVASTLSSSVSTSSLKSVICIFAHSFGNASAFCTAEERAQNHDQLLNAICIDPAIRLWMLSGSVVDDLIEAVSMQCPDKPPTDPVNFNRLSHRIMEAEELLIVLQGDPSFKQSSDLIKVYSGVFSVWKCVVSWLMGYYHSATSQATAATHSLMAVIPACDVLFFCAPLALLFVAKIHQLSHNTVMFNLCLDALKGMEDTLPAIHYVYNDLLTAQHSSVNQNDFWFPMLWKMLSSLPSLRQLGMTPQSPSALAVLDSSFRTAYNKQQSP